MGYISLILIPLVGLISIILINHWIKKKIMIKEKKMSINDFIICMPITYVIIILISIMFITALVVLLTIFEIIELYVFIISSGFILIFDLGCFILIRQKIIIKDDSIIKYNGIGQIKSYTFGQIIKIKAYHSYNGLASLKVFSDKKKMFIVSNIHIGYNLFLQKIQSLGLSIENTN